MNEKIIEKLSSSPLVLLLGQSFLEIYDKKDFLLEKTINKYASNTEIREKNYNILFSLGINSDTDREAFFAWSSSISEKIIPSERFRIFSKIRFSHVYTSSFDSSLERIFSNPNKNIQPIYDNKYNLIKPRNRNTLHISYLYGCNNQVENEYLPPITSTQKILRDYVASKMLDALPRIVTPNGLVLIDGFNFQNDWLQIDKLYGHLNALGNQQILLFGFTGEATHHPIINELVLNKKLIIFKQSLIEFLEDVEDRIAYSPVYSKSEDESDHWVKYGQTYHEIPAHLWIKTSQNAFILEEKIFELEAIADKDILYQEFRKFISYSFQLPYWNGYMHHFALIREYYINLYNIVLENLNSKELSEEIIFLHGQTSVGKTISLGQLAYDIYTTHHYPVLFIQRSYQSPQIDKIDEYIRWVEGINNEKTLIIWDGMLDLDYYYEFLRRLQGRGRKCTLVCSSYRLPDSDDRNRVLADPVLMDREKSDLLKIINEFDSQYHSLSATYENNILAFLYRALPITRSSIKKGLNLEKDSSASLIQNIVLEKNNYHVPEMGYKLFLSGLINEDKLNEISFQESKISLAKEFLHFVFTAGQFGFAVPLDLLFRCININEKTYEYVRYLSEIDLIRVVEDESGNLLVSARNTFEAQLLVKTIGGIEQQVNYIERMILCVDLNYFNSSIEIEFIVDLLSNVAPNKNDPFLPFSPIFIAALRNLREQFNTLNPRLVLKEASFIREYAKLNPDKYSQLEFDEASLLLQNVITKSNDNQNSPNLKYLRIEHLALTATKIRFLVDNNLSNNKELVKTAFNYLREQIRIVDPTRPDNYHALDVLTWCTDYLINRDVFNLSERAEIIVEVLNYYDLHESEGVRQDQLDQFIQRKHTIAHWFTDSAVRTELLNKIEKQHPALYLYLKIRIDLRDISLYTSVNTNLDIIEKSFFELENKYYLVEQDHRLLSLYFRLWWLRLTKLPQFYSERMALSFLPADWEKCISIIDALIKSNEYYNSPSMKYLKAVALFHTNQHRDSLNLFHDIDSETDSSNFGKKRIIRYFLYSDYNGTPLVFDGIVNNTFSSRGNIVSHGDIFISQIRIYIRFLLKDFGLASVNKGEKLSNFNIAFNFRGPIATPIK